MFYALMQQMKKALGQMDTWFDAATAYAKTRSFDPNTLLTARLAPDQFALARQIQTVCDTAKLCASRLTGKEVPKHDDTEKTFDELRARVRWVQGFLSELRPEDFAGAATRVVSQPRWQGKVMTGQEYFLEHALGNFYFHLTTAYAILRHNGVPLGKADYLGPLSLKDPA